MTVINRQCESHLFMSNVQFVFVLFETHVEFFLNISRNCRFLISCACHNEVV